MFCRRNLCLSDSMMFNFWYTGFAQKVRCITDRFHFEVMFDNSQTLKNIHIRRNQSLFVLERIRTDFVSAQRTKIISVYGRSYEITCPSVFNITAIQNVEVVQFIRILKSSHKIFISLSQVSCQSTELQPTLQICTSFENRFKNNGFQNNIEKLYGH